MDSVNNQKKIDFFVNQTQRCIVIYIVEALML